MLLAAICYYHTRLYSQPKICVPNFHKMARVQMELTVMNLLKIKSCELSCYSICDVYLILHRDDSIKHLSLVLTYKYDTFVHPERRLKFFVLFSIYHRIQILELFIIYDTITYHMFLLL